MKKAFLLLLPFLVGILSLPDLRAQCHAQFTWEQIPGTLQIHFHSTSTSEHDIVSYVWHFGDGDEGDGSNPYHTYDTAGVYLVCLIITDNNGCVSDVCHEVNVAAASSDCEAAFTWEQLPGTLQLHFHSTSTSEHDIVSYVWHFGDGTEGDGSNPYHTYDEPGEYLVCLIITDNVGCVSDICHEVNVEGIPSECHAGFNWEQFPGSLEVDFINTSTSEHDIVSYHWNFGDGHEGDGASPSHTYAEPGTYLVCLIIINEAGCVSDVCHEVTVVEPSSDCHASFTWEQIGGSLEIIFHSTSTSEHDIVSYGWNFGDGHMGDGANPHHIYSEPGTYLVCLRIEDTEGCVSEICHEVTVEGSSSECQASFTWDFIPGTLGVHFFSHSTSQHDIVSITWHFGDGQEGDGANPTHEYNHPGTYLVCIRIEDSEGCVSELCHEVTVGEMEEGCHASFIWEPVGGTLEIHYQSTSTSEHDIVSYHWNFGDGHEGDGINPHHTYEEPGTYLVCLVIITADSCVSDVCHEVTVGETEEECHAAFTWDVIPGTLGVHFFSQSTSPNDIVSITWHFGDGHEGDGANPSHEYNHPGTYVVCIRIEDSEGCVSELCHEVTVGEMEEGCHASFIWEPVGGTLEIHYQSTSTSQHDIVSYHWNFGDGHEGDGINPHHTYLEPGTYLVCLVIITEDSCVSDVCHEVTVGETEEECHAAFTWDFIPGSLGVHFFSQSTSPNDIISITWHFGDGQEGEGPNPIHEYDEPGTYVVCIRIEDTEGCVSELCHEVTVGEEEEECNAAFNFEEDDFGVIHFNNNSTGAGPHTTWLWTFGDGHSSTEENPEYEYAEPGIYTVCLIMTDTTSDCLDDICLTLAFEMSWEELHFDEANTYTQFSATASSLLDQVFEIYRYTNPASDEIRIDYNVDNETTIQFELYDLTGNKKITKISENQTPGKHHETLDINNTSPGLYILTITNGEKRITMGVNISR